MKAKYIAVCIEHDLPLNNGMCPLCRDANGQPFVLDMQSYYLAPVLPPVTSSTRVESTARTRHESPVTKQ